MYLPPHSNQTFPQCPSSAPPELSITGRWRVGVEYRIKYNFERHLTIVISSFFIHDSRDFLGKGKKGYRKIKDKASETCVFFRELEIKMTKACHMEVLNLHHTNNKMYETLIFLLTGRQTAEQNAVFPFPPFQFALRQRFWVVTNAIPTPIHQTAHRFRQDAVDMILQRCDTICVLQSLLHLR